MSTNAMTIHEWRRPAAHDDEQVRVAIELGVIALHQLRVHSLGCATCQADRLLRVLFHGAPVTCPTGAKLEQRFWKAENVASWYLGEPDRQRQRCDTCGDHATSMSICADCDWAVRLCRRCATYPVNGDIYAIVSLVQHSEKACRSRGQRAESMYTRWPQLRAARR